MSIENLTLEEMQAQIQALQEAMDERLRAEIPKAKEQILEIANKYGIKVSFEDEPKPKKTGTVQPKYRNPNNPEQTWSGRGRKSQWVVEALGKGLTLDDLLIEK